MYNNAPVLICRARAADAEDFRQRVARRDGHVARSTGLHPALPALSAPAP